jgi:hypothetical protein
MTVGKSNQSVHIVAKTEPQIQPVIHLLRAVFGEQPTMYYLHKALEKNTEALKESAVCFMDDRLYNAVDVDKLVCELSTGKMTKTVYGNMTVFQRVYHDHERFLVPCVGDGLPFNYIVRDNPQPYYIKGSTVVAAVADKDEIRSNMDAVEDLLYGLHLGIHLAGHTQIDRESKNIRIKLSLLTEDGATGVLEMARALDKVSEKLHELAKTEELFTFLRTMRARNVVYRRSVD